jgi:hypothetical protein
MSVLLLFQPGVSSNALAAPSGAFVTPKPAVLWKTVFNIDGVRANQWVRASGVEMTRAIGNRTILRCQTLDPEAYSGSYRVQVDKPVVITTLDGFPLFRGMVIQADEEPLGDTNTGVVTDVTAVGVEVLAENKAVDLTFGSDPVSIIIAGVGNPGRVQTAVPHGLVTGNEVVIEDMDGGTNINGTHQITKLSDLAFTIPIPITAASGGGTVRKLTRLGTIMLALQDILLENGITFDPVLLDPNYGPLLEKTVLSGSVADAFNTLADTIGWIHRFTPFNIFEFFEPGTKTASFALTNVGTGRNILGPIKLSRSKTRFANRVTLRYGGTSIVDRSVQFTADGSQSVFELPYRPVLGPVPQPTYDTSNTNWEGTGGTEAEWRARYPPPASTVSLRVYENGFVKLVGVYGVDVYDWTYRASDNTLVHSNGTLAAGTVISAIISVQMPLKVVVEDLDSISALTAQDMIVDRPDIFDESPAYEAAYAVLRKALAAPARKFTISTKAGFALPGTVIPVTADDQLLSETDCMITEVRTWERMDGEIIHDYSLVEGTEAQGNWVDYFKELKGGGTSSSSSSTSSVSPPPSIIIGGGGNAGGTGTAGKLVKWVSDVTIGNSKVSETASGIDVAGNIAATAFKGTGVVYNLELQNAAGATVMRNPAGTLNVEFLGNVKAVGVVTVGDVINTTGVLDMTLQPGGDLILDPGGKDVLPARPYDVNLGMLTKKYLTLHAGELWVETLVAQETMATIGGRIIVAPTTALTEDVTVAQTFIRTKHNNLFVGDRIRMESAGKLEFMAVVSGALAITGGYQYTVIRNLDGTGANLWYAGDSIVNTGQPGNGFLDIYSVRGARSSVEIGPAIVGNLRYGLGFNDWAPAFAIGNLNGLYGYSGNVYGAVFGDELKAYVKIDPINGVRIGYGPGNVYAQIDAAGNASFRGVVTVTGGNAAKTDLSNVTTIDGGKITTGSVTANKLAFTPVSSSNVVATINASSEGILINAAKLTLTGVLQVGGAAADINAGATTISGGKITTGSIAADRLNVTSLAAITAVTGALTVNNTLTMATGSTISWDNGVIDKAGIRITGASVWDANKAYSFIGYDAGLLYDTANDAISIFNNRTDRIRIGSGSAEWLFYGNLFEHKDPNVGTIGETTRRMLAINTIGLNVSGTLATALGTTTANDYPIIETSGELRRKTNGANGTFASPTSITVQNGIVTAVS